MNTATAELVIRIAALLVGAGGTAVVIYLLLWIDRAAAEEILCETQSFRQSFSSLWSEYSSALSSGWRCVWSALRSAFGTARRRLSACLSGRSVTTRSGQIGSVVGPTPSQGGGRS